MSDLISRSALLEELEKFAKDYQWREKRTIRERWLRREGILIMMKGVENFPTVDAVEVRHGRWEKREYIVFYDEFVDYRCSECNTIWDSTTNYCPNCGADMRERKEGE